VAKNSKTVAGLDIGTTKICCLIGHRGDTGELELIGMGVHPSRGLRKGVVINVEATMDSIKNAVREAEASAGLKIDSVVVGIAGEHITGFNSNGAIAIKHGEVVKEDMKKVLEAAKAVAIPTDREILHVIPQEYIVDDQEGLKNPLGISGVRLEVRVHIITGSVVSAQNIVKCVNRAGLEVRDIVLEQLASSEAVLTDDEKQLGVILVEIGGGTTDMAVFYRGSVRHTSVLPIGGNQITNDIAVGLRTPTEDAERIKQLHGCAFKGLIRDDELLDVPTVGSGEPRLLSRKLLGEIIEPRGEEIFNLAKKEIAESSIEGLIGSGVVITGGSTILKGMREVAQQVFKLHVRMGLPMEIKGLSELVKSPMYSTSVGLLLYGDRYPTNGKRTRVKRDENLFHRIRARMVEWFSEFF
jgi:cell division protein FtsA